MLLLLVSLEDGQLLAGRVLEQLLEPSEAVVHDEVHLLLLHVVQHVRQLDDVAMGQPLQQLYLSARQNVVFLTLKPTLLFTTVTRLVRASMGFLI